MLSNRYTVVIADRRTGVVRRFTIGLRPLLAVVSMVVTLPVLIGLGAAWKAKAEVADLYAAQAALELENGSFRDATGALTGQIAALQTAISDLGGKAALDPALQSAMDKLPAIAKNRAMGGAAAASSMVAAPRRSPLRKTPSACSTTCFRASKPLAQRQFGRGSPQRAAASTPSNCRPKAG